MNQPKFYSMCLKITLDSSLTLISHVQWLCPTDCPPPKYFLTLFTCLLFLLVLLLFWLLSGVLWSPPNWPSFLQPCLHQSLPHIPARTIFSETRSWSLFPLAEIPVIASTDFRIKSKNSVIGPWVPAWSLLPCIPTSYHSHTSMLFVWCVFLSAMFEALKPLYEVNPIVP